MPYPSVYIEELNNFYPQINALDTTLVLFIGYTKKYTLQENDAYPIIHSISDFVTFYGDNNVNETNSSFTTYLYDSVSMFFANGGRNCKILSINKNTFDVDVENFINALDELSAISYNIVCCPDSVFFSIEETKKIHNKILHFCHNERAMYIIDISMQYIFTLNNRPYFDESHLSYGAAYMPWIVTSHNYETRTIPASGAIAGVWVQNDLQRGVWKNPAGLSLQNVADISLQMNDAEINNFNANTSLIYINPLKKFKGKGVVIWGGRTLAGVISFEWRYISVCRFMHHIEKSIYHSLQWIVFEPNTIETWNKAKVLIGNFLNYYWRMGALVGIKPEHAYFIQIGLGNSMTNIDIENGNIIIDIGLACVKPAEFIILKLKFISGF